MGDEALARKLPSHRRGRRVSGAPGRRRVRGAAVLAPLLLLAACTGTGGPPMGGPATSGIPTATSGPPPIDADGKTSPSAVWSSGPRVLPRPRGAGQAVLIQVRTGRHDGFDRVVFEFRDGLPGYQVRYAEEITTAAGTPVRLLGEAFLLLAFDGARASEPGGGATFELAKPRPGYRSIKHVRLVDDAGGRVRFGIGLGGVAGYKVSELPPDRMYVDVAA
jgi:hypothetical protein